MRAHSFMVLNSEIMCNNKIKKISQPGVEPGPSRWEPEIMTARLLGIIYSSFDYLQHWLVFLITTFCVKVTTNLYPSVLFSLYSTDATIPKRIIQRPYWVQSILKLRLYFSSFYWGNWHSVLCIASSSLIKHLNTMIVCNIIIKNFPMV